jgi:hypothetical protein
VNERVVMCSDDDLEDAINVSRIWSRRPPFCGRLYDVLSGVTLAEISSKMDNDNFILILKRWFRAASYFCLKYGWR